MHNLFEKFRMKCLAANVVYLENWTIACLFRSFILWCIAGKNLLHNVKVISFKHTRLEKN